MRAARIILLPVNAGIVGATYCAGVFDGFTWQKWVVIGINLVAALGQMAYELAEDRP
jgi:hypothetical protein